MSFFDRLTSIAKKPEQEDTIYKKMGDKESATLLTAYIASDNFSIPGMTTDDAQQWKERWVKGEVSTDNLEDAKILAKINTSVGTRLETGSAVETLLKENPEIFDAFLKEKFPDFAKAVTPEQAREVLIQHAQHLSLTSKSGFEKFQQSFTAYAEAHARQAQIEKRFKTTAERLGILENDDFKTLFMSPERRSDPDAWNQKITDYIKSKYGSVSIFGLSIPLGVVGRTLREWQGEGTLGESITSITDAKDFEKNIKDINKMQKASCGALHTVLYDKTDSGEGGATLHTSLQKILYGEEVSNNSSELTDSSGTENMSVWRNMDVGTLEKSWEEYKKERVYTDSNPGEKETLREAFIQNNLKKMGTQGESWATRVIRKLFSKMFARKLTL